MILLVDVTKTSRREGVGSITNKLVLIEQDTLYRLVKGYLVKDYGYVPDEIEIQIKVVG